MPSLIARLVGQNSGPTFRRLWTKVNRIRFAYAGVSVVCNAVFRLTICVCVCVCLPSRGEGIILRLECF